MKNNSNQDSENESKNISLEYILETSSILRTGACQICSFSNIENYGRGIFVVVVVI